MANNHKEQLIAWLNDAYAMEEALVPILKNHAEDAANIPEMARRIEQHVDETRRHADRVRQCIENLGGSTSSVKTAIGGLFGAMNSISTGMYRDELVKNCLMDFATENFEIASYRALIAAAETYGDDNVVSVCQSILEDEMEMADWLNNKLPMVVSQTYRELVRED